MEYSLKFMLLSSLGRLSQVCRVWSKVMDSPNIWIKMFDVEKFPRIEEGYLTAKEDFQFMRKITYSARIAELAGLGKFVGEVPMISRETFLDMKMKMDSFDPSKMMYALNRFLVEPTHFFRVFDQALYDDLIAHGDFDNSHLRDGGMMVPYSAKNIKVLARHAICYPNFLLSDLPVFAFPDVHMSAIFNQCSKMATAVKVSIHRVDSPAETAEKNSDEQNDCLQKHNCQTSSFTSRLYFDVIEILTTNDCPDSNEVSSRTSDLVKVQNTRVNPPVEMEVPVSIGNFDPFVGLFIDAYGNGAENARAAASQPVKTPALNGPSSNGKRSYDAAFGNGN